ncbi:MAG: hydantoinase/oxoprolinase family protein [Candidatus Aminicenantales bacterium]
MAEERIGIDTGGTFTDFVIFTDGKIVTKKVLSTPSNLSQAILEGIREFLRAGSPPLIIHGTTIATNALLERKGGRIALLTTKGFEDVLLIGRQNRRNLYSLKGEQKNPILARSLCFGIEERTAASGQIEKIVDRSKVIKILEKLKVLGIEAVAVSFIHSYANSLNERIVHRELRKARLLASVSSRLIPEYREYERTSTTAVNAYLMPILDRYLSLLEKKLRHAELKVMQSNEGYISAAKAKTEPIRSALSGPAGGVVGALHLGKAAGFSNIISFDMGGTSTDVSLIEGRIRRTTESVIGDFPIRIPIIDIHTVGAGGGSIAYMDQGGSLRVGPQSAGADPGPACYGKGHHPTVTDANLYLGRIDPELFLGGRMKIYPERSEAALHKLAKKISKSVLETALGIVAIANANMEKAIRVISIERGYDPRDFSLFSFGGAGGMHAAEIAANLQMKKVIVPLNAGVLSALGLLLADSIKDYSKSILKTSDRLSPQNIERLFVHLERRGLKEMAEDGFSPQNVRLLRFLDLRYLGQSYEITISYQRKDGALWLADFHREHEKLYSYHNPHGQLEIVNIRLKAVGLSKKIKLKKFRESRSSSRKAWLKSQTIYAKGKNFSGSVYDRARLNAGSRLRGPALIVDFGSTTFLPPGFGLKVDGFLNLIIQKDN